MKMLLQLAKEEGEYPVLTRLYLLKWARKLSILSLPVGNPLWLPEKKENLV
jgi:hypothetical protein